MVSVHLGLSIGDGLDKPELEDMILRLGGVERDATTALQELERTLPEHVDLAASVRQARDGVVSLRTSFVEHPEAVDLAVANQSTVDWSATMLVAGVKVRLAASTSD